MLPSVNHLLPIPPPPPPSVEPYFDKYAFLTYSNPIIFDGSYPDILLEIAYELYLSLIALCISYIDSESRNMSIISLLEYFLSS